MVGAIITGDLDLRYASVAHPLRLSKCLFTGTADLSRARLSFLDLSGTHLTGLNEHDHSSLIADDLTVTHNVRLASEFTTSGSVRLLGADLGGQLDMAGANLGANTDQISLFGDGLQVASDVTLSNGFVTTGAVRFLGAKLGGQLDMAGAKLGADSSQVSFQGDGLRVASIVSLVDGFTTTGAVRLVGAHLGSQLSMDGAALGADADQVSLVGFGLKVSSDARFLEGFTTTGSVRLMGADFGGQLGMDGATLGADAHQVSFHGDALKVASILRLANGFTTTGSVRLVDANLGSQLSMDGATLGADANQVSFRADALKVASIVNLGRGFTTTGLVRLQGAECGSQLSMAGAKLGADANRISLSGDGMQVTRNLRLVDGFTTTGSVRLPAAHVGGQVTTDGATLGADTGGRSVNAEGLRAESDVFLRSLTTAGSVQFRNARIARLVLTETSAPGATADHVGGTSLPVLGDVTGWRLGDVLGAPRRDRRVAARWLSSQNAAQPWQEFADFYDRIGQPSDARWMRYRSARRSTAKSPWWARPGRWLYLLTTGHGYYAAPLTLAWLLVIFTATFGLVSTHQDAFWTPTTVGIRSYAEQQRAIAAAGGRLPAGAVQLPDPLPARLVPAQCTSDWDVPCLRPLTYAAATAIPATSSPQPWNPTPSWLNLTLLILRGAAWIFTALFLAGITGLLRKQT